MNEILLHREIGIPKRFIESIYWQEYETVYFSNHAKKALMDEVERYRLTIEEITQISNNILDYINAPWADMFEIGIIWNRVSKFVVKTNYNPRLDLVIAVAIHTNWLVVKTCYTNTTWDNHRTLDKSKYSIII